MSVDKNMNVLIVDDYKTMLRIIRNLLRQLGFVNIDEANQSLIFAGNIPQGGIARLMRGSLDALIEGASGAGEQAKQAQSPVLAVLVSCIGRKLLMGQRVAEEVEAVAHTLGDRAVVTGFYSYGEIAPHARTGHCELHNQTMTITTIGER